MRGLVIVLLLGCVGCVTVRPWEREHLAGPTMQFEPDPLAWSGEQSIYEITEGGTFAAGGSGSAGAGCGCH
jgi:Domain of unknown function (DUF4266)